MTEPGEAGVLQLCADEREGIWSRTKSGFFWHGHDRLERYPFGAGPWPQELFYILPARGEGVWLAARDGLVLFRAGKVVERWDRTNGLPCDGVDSMHWDAENHLWITRKFNLWRFDGKQFAPAEVLLGSNITARAICFESPGRAWFGNWGRLDMWEKGRWSAYTSEHGIPSNNWVTSMRIDSAGRRWVKPEHGLLLWDGEHFNRTSGTDLLPETDIRPWMQDREGGVWIGTGRGGVYRLQEKLIRVLDQKSGLTSSSAHTICEGQNGRLWVGTLVGLNSVQRGEIQGFRTSDPSVGNNFNCVLEDRKGRVWVGLQDAALFQLKEGVFVPEPLPGSNSVQLRVTSLHEDHAGRLWIGTTEGLFCRNNDSIRRFGASDGLTDSFVRGIVEGSDGVLWIGTARGGLHALNGNRFKRCGDSEGFSGPDTRPLHVEPDQTVWFAFHPPVCIGSRNGKIRTVTMEQGLVDSEILSLLDDGLGNFWFSCHHGIYRVAKSEIHAVADGRTEKLNCSLLRTCGWACQHGVQRQRPTLRLETGRWTAQLPHNPGAGYLFSRGLAKNEKLPPILIEQVKANEQVVFEGVLEQPRLGQPIHVQSGHAGSNEVPNHVESTGSLRFQPGTAQVIEVRYTATSLAAPDKVRFQWKLDQATASGAKRVHNGSLCCKIFPRVITHFG